MPSSTIRTVLGFIKSVAQRRIPMLRRGDAVEGIFNYLYPADIVATSGQPNEAQLVEIANAGYDTVVNLAPTSLIENSVLDEENILAGCGVRYIHIPVDFQNPTDSNFEEFVAIMREHDNDTLWVHCAANMRVSAFMERYRRSVLGHDPEEARPDMLKIWEPYGVWKDFIKR